MKLIINILFTSILTSCFSSNVINEATKSVTINYNGGVVSDSTIFDKSTYFAVRDKRIDFGSIDRVWCSGDTLFLPNGRKNEIVLMNTHGAYLSTINRQGRGHGEYIQLIDFAIDEKSSHLMCLCSPSSIYIYDYNGNFISKKELKHYYSEISIDSSFVYLRCITDIEEKQCDFTIDAFNKENWESTHLLPVEKEYAPHCNLGRTMFSNSGFCNLTRKFDRNMYRMKNGEVYVEYDFLPNKYTLIPKDEKIIYECTDLLNLCMKDKKIYGFSNIVHQEDFLMFSTNLWDIVIANKKDCNRLSNVMNSKLNIPLRLFRPIEGNGAYQVLFYLQEHEIASIKRIISENQKAKEATKQELIKLIDEADSQGGQILFLYKIRDK